MYALEKKRKTLSILSHCIMLSLLQSEIIISKQLKQEIFSKVQHRVKKHPETHEMIIYRDVYL